MGKKENMSAGFALREQIVALENKRALEEIELRNLFKETNEVLKPSNLIRSAIKDLASSPEIKKDIGSSLMGMAVGFLSKKAVVGATVNPIKLVLGNVLENLVSTGVSKNSDAITSTVMSLVKKFTHKDKPTTNEDNKPTDERN